MKALDCNNETSLYKGIRDASPVSTNMETIARYITSDFLHESTEKYRYFSSAGISVDADKEKKKAMCFTPSVICEGGHGKNNIRQYIGRSMADFDDVPAEDIALAKKLLENDPYALLSYITISGTGIRIIYQTEVTDIYNHPFAFKQGNDYYASLLHFRSDEKCKNVTRCSIICEDAHAHFNPDAEVMHIEIPPKEAPNFAKTHASASIGRIETTLPGG